MKLLGIALIALMYLGAAEDPWAKVIALKSGSEIRIFKAGDKQPIQGQFSEADQERAIVVVKNTQMAIAKADILKLEAKPLGAKGLKTNSKTGSVDPNVELSKPRAPAPGSTGVPATQSSSSGFSYSKPGFELIYSKPSKQP